MTPEMAPPLLTTTQTGGRLSSRQIHCPPTRRAALAVRSLEALASGHDYGTSPGTKVNQLTQQPIAELALATRERIKHFTIFRSPFTPCHE
ncbi:hypothetical protein TNCV_4431861 [Trichonephila clavipes]|nr:hypothetical protein TNCV_4431861 [Trichonephila clavipes]